MDAFQRVLNRPGSSVCWESSGLPRSQVGRWLENPAVLWVCIDVMISNTPLMMMSLWKLLRAIFKESQNKKILQEGERSKQMSHGCQEQGSLASIQAPCPQVPAQLTRLNLHQGSESCVSTSSHLLILSGEVGRWWFSLFLASCQPGLVLPVAPRGCGTSSTARGLRSVPFPKEWSSLLLASVPYLPRGQGHHPASDLEAAD